VSGALSQALKLGLIGDGYILSMLRRESQKAIHRDSTLELTGKLAKYKAAQKDPEHYDKLLRSRSDDE